MLKLSLRELLDREALKGLVHVVAAVVVGVIVYRFSGTLLELIPGASGEDSAYIATAIVHAIYTYSLLGAATSRSPVKRVVYTAVAIALASGFTSALGYNWYIILDIPGTLAREILKLKPGFQSVFTSSLIIWLIIGFLALSGASRTRHASHE